MSKRIAILLNGEIKNDYRVIKVIQSLSKEHLVDLYYINGNSELDQKAFNNRVKLFSFDHKETLKTKLLRHSFFCYEFIFFIREVTSSKKKYDFIWANDLPTLYPAWSISRKLNAKLVYDAHEIYNETLNQFFPRFANGIKRWTFAIFLKIMRRHGYRMEQKLLPSVDTFMTVNRSLL